MDTAELAKKISSKGLRVTPQRVAILAGILDLKNHPTAENIQEHIKEQFPNISVATVYKTLESFVENDLLKKVKTESGIMRYDPILSNHHHLYCKKTDRIEDYEDEQLDDLIRAYFAKKGIKRFKIEDIKLQITGTFK